MDPPHRSDLSLAGEPNTTSEQFTIFTSIRVWVRLVVADAEADIDGDSGRPALADADADTDTVAELEANNDDDDDSELEVNPVELELEKPEMRKLVKKLGLADGAALVEKKREEVE